MLERTPDMTAYAAPPGPRDVHASRPAVVAYLGGTAAALALFALAFSGLPWFFFWQNELVGRLFGYLFGFPLAAAAVIFGLAGLVQAVAGVVVGRVASRAIALTAAVMCAAAIADGVLLFGRVLPG